MLIVFSMLLIWVCFFPRESMFVCANYDPVGANLELTLSKRSADESLYDMENVHFSSTKMLKDVKKEK